MSKSNSIQTRVLLAGPYGGLNLGDDLIMKAIATELESLHVSVTITSFRPHLAKETFGLSAIPMLDAKRRNFSALAQLNRFDWVTIGGGQQIQESRFGNPFWGLLPSVTQYALAANALKKPFVLWGVGVEPIRHITGRAMARYILTTASLVSVRDTDSQQRLVPLAKSPDQVLLGADPVFGLDRRELNGSFTERMGLPERYILFCPANDRRTSSHYIQDLLTATSLSAKKQDAKVVVFFMDRQEHYDLALLSHQYFHDDPNVTIWDPSHPSLEDVVLLHRHAQTVVASRMHSVIVGATQGIPTVNVARGAKMESLGEMTGSTMVRTSEVELLTPQELTETITEARAIDGITLSLLRSRADRTKREIANWLLSRERAA